MADFFQKKTAPVASKSSEHKDASEIPWIEKYRPKVMDDIAQQEEVVTVLKKTMESKNLPHLLFYGPPGTGKTSTILALCRELFGPELMKTRVLELNASDERGIQVIREKVKNFAQVSVALETMSGYPCPPYKIIILDEADSMTKDAQHALRRTMEKYSKITRFCIVCNYVTRIIEPLTSRCAKFRFKSLDEDNAKKRLEFICKNEGVNYSPKTLETLIQVSEGDLRKAIMLLQSAFRFYGKEQLTPGVVTEISGLIPSEVVDWLYSSFRSKKPDTIEKVVTDAQCWLFRLTINFTIP